MVLLATIGCFVCILFVIALFTFIIAITSGNAITIDDIHADDVLGGLILSVILFTFIVSFEFMHFKFYPEKRGYIVIETETETEELENADSN